MGDRERFTPGAEASLTYVGSSSGEPIVGYYSGVLYDREDLQRPLYCPHRHRREKAAVACAMKMFNKTPRCVCQKVIDGGRTWYANRSNCGQHCGGLDPRLYVERCVSE
jgi:hypothetical protein